MYKLTSLISNHEIRVMQKRCPYTSSSRCRQHIVDSVSLRLFYCNSKQMISYLVLSAWWLTLRSNNESTTFVLTILRTIFRFNKTATKLIHLFFMFHYNAKVGKICSILGCRTSRLLQFFSYWFAEVVKGFKRFSQNCQLHA